MSHLYTTRPTAGRTRILWSLVLVAGLLAAGSAAAQTPTLIGASPYTVPATGSYTIPAGVTSITVQCWGGGGGGGGSDNSNGHIFGGGGGGGAYASSTLSVTPGTTYAITVGAAGTGGIGSSSTGNGTNGGASVFGASLVVAVGGTAGAAGGIYNTGSTGGSAAACTGTTTYSGGNGDNHVIGTAGGGSAGINANGNNYVDIGTPFMPQPSGQGGPAVTGGGAGGDNINGGPGGAGGTPGGGGAGGVANAGFSSATGGAGGAGQVIITYTVNPMPQTWLGHSTNWDDGTNWSTGAVPNSCSDNVVIPSNISYYPVLTQNESIGDLTLQAGASVTLGTYNLSLCGNLTGPASGTGSIYGTSGIPSCCGPQGLLVMGGAGGQTISGYITVDGLGIGLSSATATDINTANLIINKLLLMYQGNFTNSGTLTLASTAGGDAYFDDFTYGSAGTYSGDMTVQRYFGNTHIGYRDIGSPVSTTVSDLVNSLSGVGGVIGQDGVDCYYSYSPYPNVQYYDETLSIPAANGNFLQGWVSYTAPTNPLSAMKGIAARTYNYNSTFTISYTGAPYSGALSTTITRTANNGWNLVSNPYPSPISWSAVQALNPNWITGTYYVYHTTGEYTGSWGSNNGATGVNSAPDAIAIGQGFFVQKATQGGRGFYMDNTVRTTTAVGYYGPSRVLDDEVRLVLGNGTNSDEVVTYTDAAATDGYDPAQDAVKMPAGSTVSLAYSIDTMDYAINVMHDIDAQTVLPLTISVSDTGSYTLTATRLNVAGLTPYLRDAQSHTLTDLTAGPVQLVLNGGQVYAGRYAVVFQADATTGIGTTAAGTTHIYAWRDRVYVKRSSSTAATISVTNLLGQNMATLGTNSAETDFELPAVQPWYAVVKVTEGEKVTVSKVLISNQ